MRIAFIEPRSNVYNGETYKNQAVGGAEAALIYMAKELVKLGFEVDVYNNCLQAGVFDGVKYYPLAENNKEGKTYEIVIGMREVQLFFPMEKAYHEKFNNEILKLTTPESYKILWLHDIYNYGDYPFEIALRQKYINKIFTLSDWHTINVMIRPNIPYPPTLFTMKQGIFQTRNGMVPYCDKEVDLTSDKDPNLFMYNAAALKGLKFAVEIWKPFHMRHPETKLKIIGGYYLGDFNESYGLTTHYKKEYDGKFNIEFLDPVAPYEMAEWYKKASFLWYPQSYPEIGPVSLLESLYYQTPIIGCYYGGTEEYVPEYSSYMLDSAINLFEDNPDRFLILAEYAYTQKDVLIKKQSYCKSIRDILTWDTIALEWAIYFKRVVDNTINITTEQEELFKHNQARTVGIFNRDIFLSRG